MKIFIVTCSILLVTFMSSFAFAKEEKSKMRIAIVDLTPKGSSKIIAEAVTNLIRSEMIDTGLFTIVERSEMKEILKEQGFQQTGCTDQSCAVQLGKLLSANKILVGEVTGVGKGFIITVGIVDVEKGVSDFSANEKADTDDVLDKSVVTLTRTMVERITGVRGAKITIEQETKFGYYTRAIVPGWGQIYVGKKQKGYIFMSSFVVSGGAAKIFWTEQNPEIDTPVGISNDGSNLYVVNSKLNDGDVSYNTVAKINLSTGNIITLAGKKLIYGSEDGVGSAARFNYPRGIAVDGTRLYVVDYGNNAVRILYP
jgi:hypothetical protein